MKNNKFRAGVPLIFLTGLSLFSLIYNIVNSHPTIKIVASAVGFLGLLGLTIFLYIKVKQQNSIEITTDEK